MLVVCDLDGTCANWGEREKRAGKRPRGSSRHALQLWLDRLQSDKILIKDKIIYPVYVLLHRLTISDKIVYLTGRTVKFEKVTRRWLKKKGFPPGPLYMRDPEDWRPAGQYKRHQLKKILKKYPIKTVVALDDDPEGDTSRVYRKLGILHLKVMG
jgi:hypothetical protein